MGSTVIVTSNVVHSSPQMDHRYGFFERVVLRRAHPISMFIDVTAIMWFTYYLWNHLWVESILVVLGARMVSLMFTWNIDFDAMAQTTLGKIALLHLQPLNMIVQICGLVPILSGIWTHDARLLMVGISLLLLGHLRGWGKVEKSFETI